MSNTQQSPHQPALTASIAKDPLWACLCRLTEHARRVHTAAKADRMAGKAQGVKAHQEAKDRLQAACDVVAALIQTDGEEMSSFDLYDLVIAETHPEGAGLDNHQSYATARARGTHALFQMFGKSWL